MTISLKKYPSRAFDMDYVRKSVQEVTVKHQERDHDQVNGSDEKKEQKYSVYIFQVQTNKLVVVEEENIKYHI